MGIYDRQDEYSRIQFKRKPYQRKSLNVTSQQKPTGNHVMILEKETSHQKGMTY